MTTGSKFSQALEVFSTIEWGRFSTGEEGEVYCPINVWRFDFKKTDPEWADQIIFTLHAVLKDFSGNVDWTLEKPEFSVEGSPGRNWILLPTSFKEMYSSRKFRTDVEARRQLYEDDPSLGPQAYEDLDKISKEFYKRLSALKCLHEDEKEKIT